MRAIVIARTKITDCDTVGGLRGQSASAGVARFVAVGASATTSDAWSLVALACTILGVSLERIPMPRNKLHRLMSSPVRLTLDALPRFGSSVRGHGMVTAWCLAAALGVTSSLVFADAALPATMTVEGKPVRKIGSALREFLFIDIYLLAAYSGSGSCDPSVIVSRDEPRYIRMQMLRDIPKDRMVSNFRKSLEKNLPSNASAELKARLDTFLGYIRSDLPEGSIAEIFYEPGKGTILKHAGRRLGPAVPGKDLGDTIWRAYFGPDTCCSDLRDDIIAACRGSK